MSKRTVTKEELERPLVPYRDALDQIVSAFSALPPEAVPLERALGLVLAEPIVAAFDVPGFDNSAMDGYAVRAADAKPGAVLRLIDDLPAGSDPQVEIGPGTAATIMTGAPLPPGADAVVPWEDTERRETEVVVLGETSKGKHVRPAGEDVRAGDEVVPAGTELRAIHVGVIASLGLTEVLAHRRPRVAILSTGDELAAPGDALEPGHVYDANRSLLAAMCARAGAEIDATALIGDEPNEKPSTPLAMLQASASTTGSGRSSKPRVTSRCGASRSSRGSRSRSDASRAHRCSGSPGTRARPSSGCTFSLRARSERWLLDRSIRPRRARAWLRQ